MVPESLPRASFRAVRPPDRNPLRTLDTYDTGGASGEIARYTAEGHRTMASRKATTKKKTAEQEQTLTIPPLRKGRMGLRLSNITPLITHAWDEKALEMMRRKQQGLPDVGRPPKNPEQDFQAARYRDAQGRDCIQAHGIKRALVNAARFTDNMKMVQLRGALFVVGDKIPILKHNGGKKPHVYGKDVEPIMREDMVRVGMGKADLRYRPQYDNWCMDVVVEYNANCLTDEQVLNMFRLAGFSIGFCEWRPECNGDYGRFDVEEVRVLQKPPKAA